MGQQEKNTLNTILSVAEEEFLKKGYRDASLRTIVKKAGVTTGAFYGYFKSKEELFDALVKEHYNYINKIYDDLLEEFERIPPEDQKRKMENYSSIGLQKMFDYIWDHKTPFQLIYKSAGGTKYENFLQNIAQKDIVSTDAFYDLLEKQGTKVERIDPLIEQLVIISTFTTFFTLVLQDIPKADAKRGLNQMFRFYRSGWNSLMHFSD